MRTKMRITASILTAMLLLLGFVGQTQARSLVHTQQLMPQVAANLYNSSVNLPTPSWWSGDCDSGNNSGAAQLGTTAYRGMKACGPGSPEYTVHFGGNTVDVNEFQCTELAMRFLWQEYGKSPYVADGYNVVSNYSGDLLQNISNSAVADVYPVEGDILSFDQVSSNGGHTAIVTGSTITDETNGVGTVTIMDQNDSGDTNGVATLHIGSWSGNTSNPAWKVDTMSGFGAVTGWLHPRTTVTSANQSTSYESELSAVTNASSTDANDLWAVGHYQTSGSVSRAYAEHWNGSSWSTDSTHNEPPNEGTSSDDNTLLGVAAFSSTNVWAVGYYVDSNGAHTLFEHWDGSSWTQSTKDDGSLYAITTIPGSSSEAWAVGTSATGKVLTYHTTDGGSTWTAVTDTSTTATLYAVSASSSNNVWAVGVGTTNHTVTLQWTGGSSWTTVTSPHPGGSGNTNILYGVTALSTSDVWAVGYTDSGGARGFAIHYDGSAWTDGTDIHYFGSNNFVTAVYALGTNNVWAVGQGSGSTTLVEQYDGSGWSQITSTSPGLHNYLYGVVVNPNNGNVWTVGWQQASGHAAQTLTEFFN